MLSACTVNHENQAEVIVFGDVIGNYTGTYRECTFTNTIHPDSICQMMIPETLRVTIADRQHIQIKSQSGHIPTLKLQFRNETGNGTDRQLEFYLIHENHQYIILARPSQSALEYHSGNPVLRTGNSAGFSGHR